MRVILLGALTALLLFASSAAALPPIKHVFVIVLENKDYEQSFGAESPAPYIAKAMARHQAASIASSPTSPPNFHICSLRASLPALMAAMR